MKRFNTVLSGLLIALVASSAQSQGAPVLNIDEPIKDVGIVQTGADVNHTFVLRNDGDRLLEILEVEPDCGCTVTEFDRLIQPGRSGEIKAVIDMSTFVGPIAKYLVVLTNDPAKPKVSLTVKAEVRPLVRVHPGYVRFLTVTGEDVEPVEQTVWASDIPNFRIEKVESPYGFVRASAREAKEGEERSEGQGQQWVIEVELSGVAPVGPMADHIVVETNHPERRVVKIPVSGFVRPILAASPPVADFGEREMTAPIHASIEIKNFSDQEIQLTEVSSSLPQVEPEIYLSQGDQHVTVTLQPGLPKGPFTAVVTVETDSSEVPRLEIEVKGTIL